jgi:hypothetical protein
VRVAWYVPIPFDGRPYMELKRWERELLLEALEEMVEEMGDGAEPPPRRMR